MAMHAHVHCKRRAHAAEREVPPSEVPPPFPPPSPRVPRRRNEDEGRDLFKALKNQHIGDTCAVLYSEWAQLEAASGNAGKAVAVLQKGLKERAEPRR